MQCLVLTSHRAGADLGDAVHGGGLFDGAVGGVYSRCGRPKDRNCGRRIDAQVMLRRQLQHILSPPRKSAQHCCSCGLL